MEKHPYKIIFSTDAFTPPKVTVDGVTLRGVRTAEIQSTENKILLKLTIEVDSAECALDFINHQ